MSTPVASRMPIAVRPALSALFLARLAELVARLEATTAAGERKALSASLFSTFLDCLDLGAGDEAQAIVDRLRPEPATAPRPVA